MSSPAPSPVEQPPLSRRLLEIIRVFGKIGVTGFGGPAVTIAMMEEEIVHRRKWLSREYFLDMVGSTNLIPGPNATEIASHAGYLRAGWLGLILGGACFIIPAALFTLAYAWVYARYGALPAAEPFLNGIKPAVLAVIVGALWRMGRTAAKNWKLGAIGLAAMAASLVGVNEILALFAAGLLGMIWLQAPHLHQRGSGGKVAGLALGPWLWAGATSAVSAAAGPTLWGLALFFVKIGAVMYGSGYVLVAFLEGGLVQELGWLTQPQLLDAIAAGQLTPGPLLSTATFIGYTLLGLPGAVVATIAVFLPSFLFVAILSPIVPKLRRSPWSGAFLDAINISALGLMGAVTVKLGVAALTSWQAWLIAALAAVAAVRFKLNSAWLVIGGAALGWALFR